MQEDSPDCYSPDKYLTCFRDLRDNTYNCLTTLGNYADQCEMNAKPFGCVCSDNCELGGGGCCDDDICRWKPSGQTLSLSQLNLSYESIITDQGQHFDNVAVYDMYDGVYPYTLGPMIFTSFSGSMNFIDGPIWALADAHMLAYYNGEWHKFYEYNNIWVGGTGTINIPQTTISPAQCVEKLGFNMECILAGGIKINSCSISYRY